MRAGEQEMGIPRPHILDPYEVPALKFGVIGPGSIADTFVSAIHRHTAQRATAVASRTPGAAEAFAQTHGIERVHPSYDALVNDPEIDAVYIATHISDHLPYAKMAVAAGKHVLLEKPLTYRADDAEGFLAEARHAGVLAMEAMWTRYLPLSSVLRQLMERGDSGSPEFLQINFGNDNRHIPRLWTPGSGGIVHDMGIYPITFAQFILGNPTDINASGSVNSDGMDEETFVTLHYDSGARAQLYISGIATVPCHAAISFEKTMVAIDHPFFVPTGLSINSKDLYFTGEHWADTSDIQGHEGLAYQATYFAKFVGEGRHESPLHTHADVVANIRVAEEICRLTGAHPWG
jgi:predicted dehydrogenase